MHMYEDVQDSTDGTGLRPHQAFPIPRQVEAQNRASGLTDSLTRDNFVNGYLAIFIRNIYRQN